jgi:hypothetical protein
MTGLACVGRAIKAFPMTVSWRDLRRLNYVIGNVGDRSWLISPALAFTRDGTEAMGCDVGQAALLQSGAWKAEICA